MVNSIASLPKQGTSSRDPGWEFKSQDIKKHPSQGSSGSGKPGKILNLEPECDLGQEGPEEAEGYE